LLVGACGGGRGGGLAPRAITEEQATPLCEADCQRKINCGIESDLTFCTNDCVQRFVGWARGDAVDSFLDCTAALTCDMFDTAPCTLGIRPLAIHEEWETKCFPALTGCVGEPGSESEVCEATPDGTSFFVISMIAAEIMPELIACLDGADCDARVNCLTASFEAHHINF
jgi:hypothetical protein